MLRSIIPMIVGLAVAAATATTTSGQEASPNMAAWPTDPALLGVPTSLNYCATRAEPLANPFPTLLRTARDMGLGTPQLGGIAAGPIADFLQKRASLFAAEAILSVSGMYGASPTDVYEGTLQYAQGFVGRYFAHEGNWPTHGMEDQRAALSNLAAAFDAAHEVPDEELANCGLVLLRGTFRESPYAAPSLYVDLMRPHMPERSLNAVQESGTVAVMNYLATDEGWMFPEGSLKAMLEAWKRPMPVRPGTF